MNELELYVDSLDPSLSNEEKVRLVKEWKKKNQPKEEEVKIEGVAEQKDATVPPTETPEASENLESGNGQLESQEIKPGEFEVGMSDEQLNAVRDYQKKYESIAKTNEVYSPEGDEYEYKFSVNKEGGLDYLTRKKGEEDFIKANELAEFSIADTFNHLNEDQKKELELYKEQLKNIQEEPGTVTLIETDPKKKNLAVRAEDGGFYVPQKELPKASTEDAMKNFEKRTGKKPSSLMELTDEDYIIQDPTLLESSVTESLMLQNKQKVLQIRETLRGIKAGFYDVFATTLRIPTFLNELAFVAMADDKTLELYNSLDVEKRQKVLNKMVGMGLKSQGLPIDNSNVVNYLQKISSNFKKKSDAINETIVQYDQTIGELFGESIGYKDGKLDLRGADARKAWDATVRLSSEALKSMPSLVQAVTPVVGITSMIAGQAAGSSLEKQKEGEDLSSDLNINSLIHGVSEGGLELITRGIAKRAFAAVPKGSKAEIAENIRQLALRIAKDFGLEGLSESATLTVNNLADSWLLNDEKAWEGYFKELVDTFLIGGAMGAGISGGGKVFNVLKQNAQASQVNRAIKDADVSTVASFYIAPKATENSIKLSQNPVAKMALDKAVQAQIDAGDISVEKGNEIKNNFIQTEGAVNTLNKLNVGEASQPAMVDLMIEQKALKQKIKEADNPSLTKEESARLSEIDTELGDLITKDKSQKIDIGAKKIAEEIGVGFESFDTQDDVDSAIATLQEEGGEIDAKNSDNYGTFVVLPDGRRIIILNKETATEDRSFTEGQHETAHAITYETVKNKPEAAIALGKALLNEIRTNKDINIKPGFQARLDQYIQDADVSQADTMEEVMTLVSDGLTDGTIEINETIGVKLGNFIRRALSAMGMKVKFKNGKDVLNFIKDYNRSVHRQQGLSRGLKKTAIEGAEVSMTPETVAETEVKESVAKESKKDTGAIASTKVQEIYDTQGEAGAFDIIEQFKPIVKKIVDKRQDAPNFDRQLLTDEIETGKRGILDLIRDYKPESGVPLAAFINTQLNNRAIEASRRVLGEEFTTDVTEAKGVVAEETTEVKTKEKPLAKKPTETVEFSQVQIEKIGAKDKAEVETKITEATKDGFKGKSITRFGETRNVPKAVADIYAGMFGLNPQTITDKTRNYQKTDAEGLTTAKQFLLKNANNDFARLPKTKDGFGKGTFLPRNVMNALYTGGKLTGTLKDYIDLIRQKPVKPIYRDAVGQTIRGLLNLHIRNRMFEDLVSTTPERLRGGAKFSKKIKTPKQTADYIEKASNQTRSSNKQEGTKQEGVKSNGKPRRVYDRNKLLGDDVKTADGETVIQGFDRVLNKFLNKNPKFNDYFKFSLVFGESRSPYGIVSRFRERVKKSGEQADIRRTSMTKDKMVTNSYVEAISKPDYIAKENAKLDLLKDFYLAVEDYLKNNPKDAWVFDGVASAATNSQNAPLRALAPALIIEVDSNGKVVRKEKGIEEHSMPQNNVGTTLTQAAKDGRVKEVWPVIEASYMQGWITLNNNDLLDVDFKKSMPKLYNKAVELLKKGKIKVDRGLLSTIRFTEAGINLDNLLYIPTGQTISEYFFGTKGLQPGTQAQLIRDYFSGEKTLEQIKEYAKDESKLSNDKAKASKRMNELMPSEIKYDKPISVQMGVDALAKSDKALNNARRPDAPVKKIRVFDFDDTLARSKSKVLYTVPNVEGGFSEGATKLKAIFMVGGPGAGKTNVGKGLQLGRRGYKVVNQDIALEAMKEESGLPAKESDYTAEQRSLRSKLGAAARKAAVAKFDKYAAAGNGMVIDGTGASYNATIKKIKALQDAGYEVHMVVATTPLETAIARNKARTERSLPDFVVEKTYESVQESLKRYREDFGDRLYEINTETIEYGKPLPNDFLQQVYSGINANKVGKVNATSFAENYDALEEQGAEFDFREFSKVIDGKKGPLFSVAEKIAAARGTDDVFILTARPADAAKPIQEFMKANGIDIPLANITGLGDGAAEAKAGWIMGKAAEGYNDFYFADDAIKNVKAVKGVLSQVDVKSKVQQAKASKRIVFDKVFNDIIEQKTGIEYYKQYSAAKAKTVGSSKGKFTFFTTPSAEDFLGLLYKTLGKGKVGDAQMAFYKTNLLDPYNRAEIALSQAKVSAGRDYKALKKQFKNIPKTLEKETGIAKYTYQHAIRTYIWNKQGIEVPGLSKRDQKRLTDFIANNAELSVFADNLITIQKGKPYPEPGKEWTAGTITTDVISGINKVNRKEYLQEWQENVDIIFSEKNINKLEAAFGAKYVEALKDSLRAMKSGSNRPLGGDRVSDGILDWLNNSVGAIMFLNTRSAVLQTISAVNFVNWGDNNILKAGKAFANQKQFWGDFLTLMNSDYLLERRDGLKINVSESEIADAVEGSKNKVNAAISYLLNKGFVFTRYADSFAIASGGATFYRNRTEALVKQGMDRKAAEEQAFNDFRAIAEDNQQSSSPSKISQQQRSLIGRIILQFGNTQLQYVRIQKRAVQDLVNKRGDWRSNISKIVYYGAIQNLLFNALQSGLAWALFDDDEEDEELTEKNKEQKLQRTLNGAIDSQLKGLGIQGAVVSGVKNALITIAEEADKKSPKFEEALDDLFSIAPALGSKVRKIKSAARTVSWNRKEIKEKGFSMDNPAYLAGAQVISAAFNIPLDRAVMKMNNMRNILNPATENWQKVALALGWSGWDVGLPYFGLAEDKPVLTETEKQSIKLFDLNRSDQVKMLLDLGLTKKEIRALTKEQQRVDQIIKLQNKKKDAGSKK